MKGPHSSVADYQQLHCHLGLKLYALPPLPHFLCLKSHKKASFWVQPQKASEGGYHAALVLGWLSGPLFTYHRSHPRPQSWAGTLDSGHPLKIIMQSRAWQTF